MTQTRRSILARPGAPGARIVILVDGRRRQLAKQYVDEAPAGAVVRISEATRNLDQNAKFHAICSDFERSGLPFAGKPRDKDQWKALLVSGHAVACGETGEVVPGLEGELVAIRESTALMSVRRTSSLIEYAIAYAMEHEVDLNDYADLT